MAVSISPAERRLRQFGKYFIAPVFALKSGIITAVAVGGLLGFWALPVLIPFLIAVFLADIGVSFYLLKDAVPDTLVNIFLHNIFEGLSASKKALLAFGLISAIGAGVAISALTYTSTTTAFATIFTLCGIVAPPLIAIIIGSFLGFIAFFALTSLFVKWIAWAIKNDIHKKIAEFFQEMFSRDPKKLLAQQILENTFKLIFVFGIIAITLVGTIAMLGTMSKALFAVLSLIPNANLLACQISSSIIAYVLMGASRLPWALPTVCTVFARIGGAIGYGIFRAGLFIATTLNLLSESETSLMTEETAAAENLSLKSTLADNVVFLFVCLVKILATLVHGFSFGALAQSGGGAVISGGLTHLDPSLPLDVADHIGQTSALVGGSIMAGAIAAGTFFNPAPPSSPSSPEETSSDKELKPLVTAQTTELVH